MPISGSCSFFAKLNKEKIPITALVVPDLCEDMLISWQALIQLKIISKQFPKQVNSFATLGPENTVRNELTLAYQDIISDKLNENPMIIPNTAMHIHLVPNAIPYSINTARLIPLRLQKPAADVIDGLMEKGVIARVDTPTAWCSPGFFVPKPDGKSVRLVTDYTKLNKFVKRPVHPFPSSKEIIQSIPSSATIFATLDAVHGYFQLALDKESSELTTFLLPSGRYKYLRAPMGLSASSDEWCRHSDVVIEGLPFAKKIVDDILIWASNLTELKQNIKTILDKCREVNITISHKKFKIGNKLKFAGHIISNQGITPDPDKITAIKAFPQPNNISELRSFLGLANQLAFFLPDFSHLTSNLRKLLSTKNSYTWLDCHSKDFEQTKNVLTSDLLVKAFDPKLETILLTDASRLHGLGFALLQQPTPSTHALIMCGSCSLSETQSRYATIELECLAIQYAIHKCTFYLKGLPSFKILTDHKPLCRAKQVERANIFGEK